MTGRYVIVAVNTADKTIYEGPIVWDGLADLGLPEGRRVIAEAQAAAEGYSPAPESPSVTVERELVGRAQRALASNAGYLELAPPTQVQVRQQVDLLTRQCSGVIRLLLRRFDSTSGT